MADPIATLRSSIRSPSDAIRWACVLEATAPKAGNVYPSQSFADLTHVHFVTAAEITATHLGRSADRISAAMLSAVQATREATGTNVNLGIVLLLGPLVAAEQLVGGSWQSRIAKMLASLDSLDGGNIYSAINVAVAGGLGEVDAMDVSNPGTEIDIRSAMVLARDRDRIALQYATDFRDLFDNVVPMVERSIVEAGDMLIGIARAHVRLLASAPDTLIERKSGQAVANEVQRNAQAVDVDDPASMQRFDDSLRSPDHRLNPGTTADLIAAALYVLLRQNPQATKSST
ncbi:triphosphoribosyl-dephospho-CoA synthase [Rubripirellula reticaptiva]|uniref:ATP:dephospho-CoA triphosphoribosyl transferase n=1 Tax=Rubripirellula reticaptiva TaxID=2528013 RepID=A0A5C6F461_9BACT|nr:triphosphoribosyl-dephospho-CoA synthase [Rubripirellula reticaptiva]TWU55314.1 ATP:dephospho-CoA triphosphoribosyl transferase [Rubripirellula reticaptiva]